MQGCTTSRAASSEDSEGKELQKHWRWRREGKRPRGQPPSRLLQHHGHQGLDAQWLLATGAGWGTPSRAGRSGGLPSLTHWAGLPRAPAAPLHPRQGRGNTGGQQQWERGLSHHIYRHPPQLLWDGLKLFPCREEKQLTVRLLARLTPQSLSKKEN